jgi:hypothetical protein
VKLVLPEFRRVDKAVPFDQPSGVDRYEHHRWTFAGERRLRSVPHIVSTVSGLMVPS